MDADERTILDASRMVNPIVRVVRTREGGPWTSVYAVEHGEPLPRFRYSEYPREVFTYFGMRALCPWPEERAFLRTASVGARLSTMPGQWIERIQ